MGSEGVTGTSLPVLNAHSDLVTDFDFSPFEDGLLATCSADSTVKIWSLSPNNLNDLSTLSPECVTSSKHRRVENVAFNPIAEYLLGYSAQNSLTLWDILYNKEVFHGMVLTVCRLFYPVPALISVHANVGAITDDSLHDGVIMSVSWTKAGTLLATCAKDKMVRVIDPRGKQVITSAQSHDNTKDSRVLWLGDSPYILTTGFDSVS